MFKNSINDWLCPQVNRNALVTWQSRKSNISTFPSFQMLDECFLAKNLMHHLYLFCLLSSMSQMSGKEKTMCFIAASDISEKVIGQMCKQFLRRSWLALSDRTNHIWEIEVNTNFLSRMKKLIVLEWSNQQYMANRSKHWLSLLE